MPFVQKGPIRYFVFTSLQAYSGLVHAVFTRQGGYSQGQWQSLNLGGSVGDRPEHVKANKELAVSTLGRDVKSIYDSWQVHDIGIVHVDRPREEEQRQQKADILFTQDNRVTLLMRFADCVPIILFDPRNNVVSLVHAGWQGTVKKAAAHGVNAMTSQYGSRSQDIIACIGPSIGPDHYQIGQDVAVQVRDSFGEKAQLFLKESNSSIYFDLWSSNRYLLEQAGVNQVETAGICTGCNPNDWFSHRCEAGKTGRFGVLAGLK